MQSFTFCDSLYVFVSHEISAGDSALAQMKSVFQIFNIFRNTVVFLQCFTFMPLACYLGIKL